MQEYPVSLNTGTLMELGQVRASLESIFIPTNQHNNIFYLNKTNGVGVYLDVPKLTILLRAAIQDRTITHGIVKSNKTCMTLAWL